MTEKPGDNDVDPNSHPDLPVVPEIPRIAHTRAKSTADTRVEAPTDVCMAHLKCAWLKFRLRCTSEVPGGAVAVKSQ